MSSKALFIVNPVAGGIRSLERVREAARWLEGQGWEVALQPTESPGHATALARDAASAGISVAVACGGDGTISEVAGGLAGAETALAVIPGGTADVWAREVRIPRDPPRAVRLVVEGRRRLIDLGCAKGPNLPPEGRHFLLMAGVGLDGAVAKRVRDQVKRRLGAAAYVLLGARELMRYRSAPVHAAMNGLLQTVDLGWMVIGNTRLYGGVVSVTRGAVADDGLLDVLSFAGHGVLRAALYGLGILVRRPAWAPGVRYHRVAVVDVRSGALPVQVDGDYLGETPMTFSVVPRALSVVLPAGLRSRLFTAD